VDVRQFLGRTGSSIALIVFLLFGLALELRRFKWAWLVNAGFYLTAFFSVCFSIFRHRGEHPEEQFLVLIFVLIPLGIAASIVIFLYWFSRHDRRPDLPREGDIQFSVR
jgi:amino acid transporter